MDRPDLDFMLKHTTLYLDEPEQMTKLRASQQISSQFAVGRELAVPVNIS